MGIFSKKWRKLLPLAILIPTAIAFTGAWTNFKPVNNSTPILIAKDAKIYNRLPVTAYGETPWSPMQLDLQQFDILRGRPVQRIEAIDNNIVLYATGNDDGTNTKCYKQNLTKDNEPHQILNDVSNLDWRWYINKWQGKYIYATIDSQTKIPALTLDSKIIITGKNIIPKNFLWNNYLIYGIKKDKMNSWYIYDLTKNKNINHWQADNSVIPILNGNKLYYMFKNDIYSLNLNSETPRLILNKIINFEVINNNYLLYAENNDIWKLHLIKNGQFKNFDIKIIKSHVVKILGNRLFFISDFNHQSQIYFLLIHFKGNEPIISKVPMLWNNTISTNLDFKTFNSKLICYKGNYFQKPTKSYDFIQRWVEPNQDFNLNVAKITSYGNANKRAVIDFNFNPNWQNKNYYLNNTNYYLNYWVDNKSKVTRIPLEKNGGNYQFALSNDDLINYDGKPLHTTISANVNGREIHNIKLAQANGLFKYDDVNDTYDYNVRNYTPPYWTNARIVGLGVGCVLAIPLLAALFFWLKRQWHKIYF